MPMNFPDMHSLKETAKVFGFRQPNIGEEEKDYRLALAAHALPIDKMESFEIKFGVGWDQWNTDQIIEVDQSR